MARESDRYSRIYAVVRRIPRGRVATYGQVARIAGLPGHVSVVKMRSTLHLELFTRRIQHLRWFLLKAGMARPIK